MKIFYDRTRKGDLSIQVTVNRGDCMGRFDYILKPNEAVNTEL